MPATPTTPGPATGRRCRRGPAWWSSARLTASTCWREPIWWLIPAFGSDHDVADLTWCRLLILEDFERRIAIVIVSLASQFWGDLSAEVKFLSVGACRRAVRLRFLPHREDAVNKAEFIEVLAAHFDGNKAEAGRALNAITETIIYQTAGGEKVTITGFGVFEKVSRPARMVRNPRTGERKRAKATAVPRFRAGTDLKAYVSGAKKVPKASKKASAKTPASQVTAAATTPAPTKTAATQVRAAKVTPATKATTSAKKATVAKKASPARTAAVKNDAAINTPVVKKTAPAKSPTIKKAAPAKAAAVKKATPAKATVAKKATPAKATVAKKAAPAKATPAKATTAKTAPAAVKKTPTKTTTTAKAVPAKTSRAKKAAATS